MKKKLILQRVFPLVDASNWFFLLNIVLNIQKMAAKFLSRLRILNLQEHF